MYAAIATPLPSVATRVGGVPGRVPLRRQLVLHPPVDRLLRAPTSPRTRSCTSGRWRSRNSSTCCGRCCSAACSSLDRAGRRPRWTALRVVVGARGASLSLVRSAAHRARPTPNRAYYGTDTRAYQLLAGALLALTPAAVPTRPAAPPDGAVGGVDRARRARAGVARRSSTIGAITAAASSPCVDGRADRRARDARRAASAKRRLSHEPVDVSRPRLVRHVPLALAGHRARDPRPAPEPAPRCSCSRARVATALAALSFHVLEHPIRASQWLNRYRVPVVAVGLTISVGGRPRARAGDPRDRWRRVGARSALEGSLEDRRSLRWPCPRRPARLPRKGRCGVHASCRATGCESCSWATATPACGSPAFQAIAKDEAMEVLGDSAQRVPVAARTSLRAVERGDPRATAFGIRRIGTPASSRS